TELATRGWSTGWAAAERSFGLATAERWACSAGKARVVRKRATRAPIGEQTSRRKTVTPTSHRRMAQNEEWYRYRLFDGSVFSWVQDAIGCSSGEPSKNIRRCGDRSGCLRCVDGVASRQTRPARGADRCLRYGPFAGQIR